ncbi:hypothetical protein L3Y34_014165 [Caenorhabditis briggsae]|uniref:Uncharacterized protein n=1 Tax=Caenorhabditis briggsae TaxID=6238 RepID=A0AAE9DRC3_CAEBR|nr:hypothetical protein L3Y34_014165 [Caenorhabditis briggsae]
MLHHSNENNTPNAAEGSPPAIFSKSHDSRPADISAEDVWYHGELNEHDANRLLQGTTPGAFLVRQTGPTRFYLSILDNDGYPKHIPIRQLTTPHYFFEGKRYEKLREIVEAFKSALFPIRKGGIMPLNGEIVEIKYLCIRSFEKRNSDEMTAELGDILTLCETDEIGWMMGRNEANGSVGIVLKSHLKPLISTVDSLSDLPYFYDTVTQEMLQFNPIGTFLLRRSSKGTDTYALLVKTQFDLIEKFLIVGSPPRGFSLAGRPFPTIGHVVARYSERAISGGVRLTRAVCDGAEEQQQIRKASGRSATTEIRWPPSSEKTSIASMSSSQCDDVLKERKEKTRRMFRGASIDTALVATSSAATTSSTFLTPSGANSMSTAMPSPANTISTGVPEHMFDHRFNYEDINELSETSSTSATTVASTVALRKSREDKQWKDCWLTLSDNPCGSSQLSVFDSQNSKLRQQLNLSTCTMFWLDESVFSADGCLFLAPPFPSNQPTLYVCFRPFSTFLKWVRMLRSRTIYQDVPPPMLQGTISVGEPNSQVSFLSVEIDKYRLDSLKTEQFYSACVSVNGVKVGVSNSFAPAGNKGPNELATVVIDSKFVIPCIPTCSTNIQLSMLSHSSQTKKGRPCGTTVTVSLNENNESVIQQSVDTAGFVFRAHRIRCPVLPLERYRPMLEMLRESPSQLLSWPSQVLPLHLKQFMYSCISHLYALSPQMMSPVIRKVIHDVLTTSTPEDVFRKDSLATGIITQCLRHLFKTPFDEFLLENSQFSQSLKSPDAAVELLVQFVDQRLLTIPLASRLLVLAAECARARFDGGEESHLVKRTLSALLILRVLNPIVFSTLNNGIGSQIAKNVQISANSAASQATNESLTPAAMTIRRMFERMILLVDQQPSNTENQYQSIINSSSSEEIHTEWVSCLAYIIAHSLTIRPSGNATTSSTSSEDVNLPISILELVRLHQM